MHSVDHLFALLIVLIQPAYEVIATRRYLKQVAAGMVADRRRIVGAKAGEAKLTVETAGISLSLPLSVLAPRGSPMMS